MLSRSVPRKDPTTAHSFSFYLLSFTASKLLFSLCTLCIQSFIHLLVLWLGKNSVCTAMELCNRTDWHTEWAAVHPSISSQHHPSAEWEYWNSSGSHHYMETVQLISSDVHVHTCVEGGRARWMLTRGYDKGEIIETHCSLVVHSHSCVCVCLCVFAVQGLWQRHDYISSSVEGS